MQETFEDTEGSTRSRKEKKDMLTSCCIFCEVFENACHN